MNFKLLSYDNASELATNIETAFDPIMQELAFCNNFPEIDLEQFYYQKEVEKMLDLGIGNDYDQAQYDVTNALVNDIYLKLTATTEYLGYRNLDKNATQTFSNEMLVDQMHDFMWPMLALHEDKSFVTAINKAFNDQMPILINKDAREKNAASRTHLFFIAITTTLKVLIEKNN